MKLVFLLITCVIFNNNAFSQQKSAVKKPKVILKKTVPKPYDEYRDTAYWGPPSMDEVNTPYVETRKIKYLCDDGNEISVFFDNGFVAFINSKLVVICKQNMYRLFQYSSLCSYNIADAGKDGEIMFFTKKGETNAKGILMNNNCWYIKKFIEVKEIKSCY